MDFELNSRVVNPQLNLQVLHLRKSISSVWEVTVGDSSTAAVSIFVSSGFDRLEVMVKPFNEIEAAKNGRGHDMGARIRLWIQMVPPDSRLRDPVVFGLLLNRLRNESRRTSSSRGLSWFLRCRGRNVSACSPAEKILNLGDAFAPTDRATGNPIVNGIFRSADFFCNSSLG